jgi:hypothetical protein
LLTRTATTASVLWHRKLANDGYCAGSGKTAARLGMDRDVESRIRCHSERRKREKTERERNSSPALLHEFSYSFFMSYPHPRQPTTTLKSQSKRTVKHENPEKFKAFVNAAEAQPVAWVVFSAEKTGDSIAKRNRPPNNLDL